MFLLIGEGAEKERIVKLAAARGLNKFEFLGQQPREQIPRYVSARRSLPRHAEEKRAF